MVTSLLVTQSSTSSPALFLATGWRPAPEKNIVTMPCWGKTALRGLSQKIAQRIASWTWDVTHERALSPADLLGGKAPVGALIGLLERIC